METRSLWRLIISCFVIYFIPSTFGIRASSFISCSLVMKSSARMGERARLYVMVILVLVLREV